MKGGQAKELALGSRKLANVLFTKENWKEWNDVHGKGIGDAKLTMLKDKGGHKVPTGRFTLHIKCKFMRLMERLWCHIFPWKHYCQRDAYWRQLCRRNCFQRKRNNQRWPEDKQENHNVPLMIA